MTVQELSIPEVKLITPTYFEDYRGYYCETYSQRTLMIALFRIITFFVSKEGLYGVSTSKMHHMLNRNWYGVLREA